MNPAAVRPTVLYVLPWSLAAIGGVNQVVLNLALQAGRSGRLRSLVLENDTAFRVPGAASPGPGGVAVRRLWLRTPFAGRQRWRSLLGFVGRLPASLVHLRALLESERVTTVNVHYPTLAALHFAVLKRLGLWHGRLLLSFHGLDLGALNGARGPERWLWHWLMAQADALVTCSTALAAELGTGRPDWQARTHTIHNGVDPLTLLASGDSASLPQELAGVRYILSVATFERKKGQDLLLRAFQTLRASHTDLQLVLIGRSTPWLDELRALAGELGLGPGVHFHVDMPHAALAPFYQHAALFCLPSRAEPFGIVLLEAGVFRLPVVATAVGGVREIITGQRLGWLVPPDSVPALHDALADCLASPGESRDRGDALHARVLEQFTWSAASARYEELA